MIISIICLGFIFMILAIRLGAALLLKGVVFNRTLPWGSDTTMLVLAIVVLLHVCGVFK